MKTAKFHRLTAVLSLVLVAVMLLTLVGCNGGGNNEDPVQNDDDVSVSTTGGDTAETTEPSATEASKTGASQSATKSTNKAPTRKTGGGGNKTDASQAPSATKPTVDKDADVLKQAKAAGLQGTKIKMMLWWTSGKDDKAEAKTFKEETGIEVTYETTAMAKYQTQLSSKVMAKNAPALAAIINEWYPQPITRNLMQPIDNVKGWDFKDEDVYALSLMDQFSYKGKHYGIALKGSNMTTFEVMFFNKSILKKSGVKKDPYQLWKAGDWNWDTCLDIALQVQKNSKGISGISNVGQYFWMLSAGEDFVKSTKAGLKNNINSSGVLNAWNWNHDMIYKHKVIDTSYTGQTPFYQGKAAMLGAGSYMMQADSSHSNYVPQNMDKGSWGVVPFPSPEGKTYAGCEGTVWGFPTGVTGDKLQAAAWYLRYFLDDYNYSARDFYPTDECWEVMKWMWDQKIQSYNSVGVLTYGGEYTAYTIQYDLVDDADTKAKLKANLQKWEGVLSTNINKIENELK